jgi:hypothetical protein
MKNIDLRSCFLVLAGALILSGCHTTESFDVETYRQNPDLVKLGDSVVLHTHSEGKVKGKVAERSADRVVLKGGRMIPTDDIVALEVRRFSAGRTIGLTLLIVVGAALVVAPMLAFGYLSRSVA